MQQFQGFKKDGDIFRPTNAEAGEQRIKQGI